MSRSELWEVSVCVDEAIEELAGRAMAGALGVFPASHLNVKTGVLRLSVFLERDSAWIAATRDRLREEWNRSHPALPFPRMSLKRLRREDWAESWKHHFRPIEVSSRLLIRPSWSRRKPRRRQRVLVLDPGLSFGTGQHPTTRFCLAELDRVAAERPGFSVLDVGTGSGILALAAVRLGAAHVEAFDYDPVAIRVARENAQRNRLEGRLRIEPGDVRELAVRGRCFDVVCANLTADLQTRCLGRLVKRLAPAGVLVLAGILRREFGTVKGVCEDAGLVLKRSASQGEWRSGAFGWLESD